MNQEVIAKLVGALEFRVDVSGLKRFNAGLSQVERRMQAMSRQADQLAKKLGLSPKTTAPSNSASLEHARKRELQLEAALAKAKRHTLAAQLEGQRLQFAGYKQAFVLNSAAIRQKQVMLAAEKMIGKTQAERLEAQAQEIKRLDALTAARSRQTSLEQRLQRQRAKVSALEQGNRPQPTTKQRRDHALKRELQLESALAKAKRHTFAAELAGKKLEFAGHKQATFLTNAAIRDKQALAVADAKAHKAQVERLRVQGQEIRNAASLAAARTRQASLEERLRQQRMKTSLLRQKELQGFTAMQRLELALQEARERGLRAAQRFADAQRTAKVREQRQAEAHQQRTDRYEGWKARQAHWETTRNNPPVVRDSGSFGLGGFTIALGAAGAAMYALTSSISYANQRIKQRQEGVQEAQGFNNTFMSISQNPDIVKGYREAFIKTQMENGGVIDTETSKDFRTLAINMAAAGKSQAQILDTWNTRQKAFAVAGTTKDDNKELNKQLGQMASDGTGAASDANIINDRMPMLTPYVVREYMKEKKIPDYPKGLAAYNKDLKGGKGVKYDWYAKAMDNLVKDNEPSLERNRNSVASQQQRADNQAYLNTNNINSNDELAKVLGERIKAERELNEAMQPLQITLTQFDIGLTKLATSMLHFAAGNNLDGSKKSDQQQTQDRMTTTDLPVNLGMVGSHDYSSIEGNTQRQGGPIGKFWNWILGVPDYRDGEANKLRVSALSPVNPVLPALDTSKFDTSQLPKRLEELMVSPMLQGLVRAGVESANRTPYVNGVMKSDESTREHEAPVVNNVSNSTTSNVTNSPTLNVTVNAPSSDPDQLARIIGKEVDQKLGRAFQQTNVDLNEAH